MSELEYQQLAGHITEKLDNTSEYEDWLIIQEYVGQLQSDLIKEQLAYKNLRDSFNEQYKRNKQLNKQLQQRESAIDEAIDMLNLIIPELWNINNNITYKLKDVRRILIKGKGDNNE